jgi:hypothetical protein
VVHRLASQESLPQAVPVAKLNEAAVRDTKLILVAALGLLAQLESELVTLEVGVRELPHHPVVEVSVREPVLIKIQLLLEPIDLRLVIGLILHSDLVTQVGSGKFGSRLLDLDLRLGGFLLGIIGAVEVIADCFGEISPFVQNDRGRLGEIGQPSVNSDLKGDIQP